MIQSIHLVWEKFVQECETPCHERLPVTTAKCLIDAGEQWRTLKEMIFTIQFRIGIKNESKLTKE
jgi:hypothetical protein